MNRADIAKALAACEALIPELRAALKADAKAEFDEQGCAPTWRLPGFTISTSVTRDSVQIEDEAAFLRWVQLAYPTEVYTETVTRIRSAWLDGFLAKVAKAGDPARDDDTVVPGLRFVPGGEFKSVSVIASSATKSTYRQIAREITSGRRPLALPSTVEAAQESSVSDPDGA